jgi:protein phosphatase
MDLTDIVELASNSDVGRKRESNEDSSAILPDLGLMVIADGMGGYKAGEVASAIAVSSIVSHLKRRLPSIKTRHKAPEKNFTPASHVINEAICQANYDIYSSAQDSDELTGMGTTVLVLLLYDNYFSVAHVGDSRLYRFRDQKLEKITNDHSLVQELVDRGFYSHDEALAKTPGNLVTRALGIGQIVNVDVYEESVKPDDLFLLCTDGLTDMLNDTEINLTLKKFSDNLNRAAQELINLANARGGKDNISVILGRPKMPFPEGTGWFKRFFLKKNR